MTTLRILRAFALITTLAYVPAPRHVHAQTPSNAPRRELRAAAAKDIRLDGRLDEPAWSLAEVGSDFVQRYPDPGRPATMRTEVRVLYDDDAVYVGARMFDPHPDSISAPLARHDPGDVSSDWIDVIFDSYNDRRTGYRFGVNPVGTKLDVYHFNDSDDDISWDAIWDVKTSIDSLGWIAEYRIPLSQLRFHRSAGEQTWGLNFYRAVARRDEWTFWSPYTPSMPGFVSAFGILRGLVGIQPPSTMEVTPYFSSRVSTQKVESGDPFARSASLGGAAGVDFRVGLGSALSLSGTINPDFGQVEVDPAIINLSAVETFLPEKRPFFLEGAGIFQFGSLPVGSPLSFSQFIHWRRIGREPQLFPAGRWADVPEQATILGAAKLSGQLGRGWSVGIADAVTQRETARVVAESGERSTSVVEPLTNYFVGRAKRDLNGGRSTVGVLGTATNRSLGVGISDRLRAASYLLGVDGTAATHDRRWTVGGFFAQSLVSGSAAAIAATQRSSVRYLQRPDKDYYPFDPTRTSLAGHDASAGVVFQGSPWFGSAEVREVTPGYEVNDLGYQTRADIRTATLNFGGIRNTSEGFVRSARVSTFTQHAWNFGRNALYHRTGVSTSGQFSSFWNASTNAAFKNPVYSDKHTRGGPLLRIPSQWEMSTSISTDGRRSVIASVTGAVENKGANGNKKSLRGLIRYRPSTATELSIGPTLERIEDGAQYIRTIPDQLAAGTFGKRYVFSTLHQRTLSFDTRADWTISPSLSFQLFAQPFTSTARFSGYKELRAPGTFAFNVYGKDEGTIAERSDGTFSVDPDAAGPASPFVIGDRANESSFVTRALRVNAVLRWEYRGGSALYVVWQQARDDDEQLTGDYRQGLQKVLDVPARNILLLKASYRVGR
jgi:hypothetical protein